MFYMSEEEFNSKLKKIQKKNADKQRKHLLKAEKNKIKQLKKSKMNTSNKVLVASIIAVLLFTIACLYIQYTTSIEVSSTLITAWYSFWTVELVSLAGIKVSKVFKENRHDLLSEEMYDDSYVEEIEEEEC